MPRSTTAPKQCRLSRALFIGGADRSGTTLLASLLEHSQAAHVTPESQFKIQAVTRLGGVPIDFDPHELFTSVIQRTPRWGLWNGATAELATQGSSYGQFLLALASSHAHSQQAATSTSLWIDHTPSNIRRARTLDEALPGSLFIHMVRDGRAVCASQLALNWGPQSPLSAAAVWSKRVAEGLAVELDGQLSGRVHRVHYEQLVSAPERVLREVCDFAGIDFAPRMLEGGAFQAPSFTSEQHALINSKPNRARIDAWRTSLNVEAIRAFEWEAGSLLQSLGYDCDHWPIVLPVTRQARLKYMWQDYGLPAFRARRIQRKRVAMIHPQSA